MILENVLSEATSDFGTEISFSQNSKTILMFLFLGCSFLVFNVGGYNNFIPSDLILFARITVVGILLFSTFILYKKLGRGHILWSISYAFLISSVGLLSAWVFGRWYNLIPGLSTSTVEGATVAKIAEVLPIVLTILAGAWLVEQDFTAINLRGGNLGKSLKLGLLVSPAGLYSFALLGGFAFSASFDTVVLWMPWMFMFSISNAFMEELMIRGLFLGKFEAIFSQNQSLILTAAVFAFFHLAIIGFIDILTFLVYLSIPFVLGLLWGYVIQKSDNIWGAVFAHMVADIIFLLVIFGV